MWIAAYRTTTVAVAAAVAVAVAAAGGPSVGHWTALQVFPQLLQLGTVGRHVTFALLGFAFTAVLEEQEALLAVS